LPLLTTASSDAGEEKEILVEHDDGIRPDISTAVLSKLKPVFKKDGSTTAGNSSQVCLSTKDPFGAPFGSTA
jgi:acetyl-CoA acyltransferase 1